MIKLVTGKDGWQFAVISEDSHLSKWAIEKGSLVTDGTVEQIILPLIKSGDTVIDVGANIGDHAKAYADKVGASGKVLAFEPYLPAYACLLFNLRDTPQATAYYMALSFASGHVSIDANTLNTGASHISTGQNETFIQCETIDSFKLSKCDFIKIDAEGFEPKIILGAEKTIEKLKPKLFIEINKGALARYGFNQNDIIKPLESFGYHYQFIDPNHHFGLDQFDLLFLPK